jgi:NRAMP (natural resistance-associated macrophage protein)-like metal ion transporter
VSGGGFFAGRGLKTALPGVNRSAMPESKKRRWRDLLGPGLITGASDDDPSGIATYSQVGAQFGYGMSWLMLFSYPLMCAIQEISARMGRTTGRGVAGNMRRHGPRRLVKPIVGLLLLANIINIGADLGAMGAALQLLVGGPSELYVAVFALLCAALQIWTKYERYVGVLKWATLSLFAYVACVLVVHVPWGEVMWRTLLPTMRFDAPSVLAIVAVLGTTISPYLFFWQSSHEAEEEKEDPEARALILAPAQSKAELFRIRVDTYIGMAVSNLVALFIIITTAATLNAHGVTEIETSAQAAEALRPIAGMFAFAVFAVGIIGTGMLAIPVLAGSAAYAVGEALALPTGLARLPHEAKAFYATIALSTLLGVGINFSPLDPFKALFWSAVINGVVAVPVMVIIMVMAMQPKVMGQFILPAPLRFAGWLATLVMTAVVVALFAALAA